MRGRTMFICIAFAALASAAPDAARAQFSPQGLFGAMTFPFRAMLGRLGHPPRHHTRPARSREASAPADTAADSPLGNAGPAVWPTAYEDVLGYAFWPDDYAEQLRDQGFDVIADTLINPPTYPKSVKVATTGSAGSSETGNAQAGPCDDPAGTTATWPVSQIEQTTQLTAPQREALGKLQTALVQALRTLKAGCTDTSSLTPRERLQVLVQQLWAVRDAGIFVRTPLQAFYESLNEEQKHGFDGPQAPPNRKQSDPKQANNDDTKQQYQGCAARGGAAADGLIKAITRKVRPDKRQDAALQALRKTSGNMARLLTTFCGTPIPADPLARLDAANNQLTSLNYTAISMEFAVNGFYAQLNPQQKTLFDSLGR